MRRIPVRGSGHGAGAVTAVGEPDAAALVARLQELSGLLSVEHLLSGGLEFRAILAQVCQHICAAVEADRCGVLLYNPDTDQLEMQPPAFGLPDHMLSICHTRVTEDCNVVRVFRTGRPALIPDVARDPTVIQRFATLFGLRSMISVPLKVNGRTLGVFSVANKRSGTFSPVDLKRVEVLSSLLAALLENQRLVQELAESERTKTMLYNIAADLAGLLDRQLVADTIVHRACVLAGARGAAVLQAADGGCRLLVGMPAGPPAVVVEAAAQQALQAGRMVAHAGCVAIPLLAGAQPEGLLVLWQCQDGADAGAVAEALLGLTPLAAMAMKNARLFHQETDMAETLRRSLQDLKTHNQMLGQVFEVHRRLTAAAMDGGGVEGICAALSTLLGHPATVYNPFFKAIATYPADKTSDYVPFELPPEVQCRLLSGWADEPRAGDAIAVVGPAGTPVAGYVAPVRTGSLLLGCLCVWADAGAWSRADHMAVEQAVQACAVELMHRREVHQVEQRNRDDFVMELLSGKGPPDQGLAQRAALLGFDLQRPYRIMVVRPDPAVMASAPGHRDRKDRWELMEGAVRNALEHRFPGSLIVRPGPVVVVLLALHRGDPDLGEAASRRAGQEIVRLLGPLAISATVGVGSACQKPADYPQAYREGLQVAELLPAGGVAAVAEFGAMRLLLSRAGDNAELWDFAGRMLKPLVDYDRDHATDLVYTLEKYLENECQLTSTAADLYVHLNTLRYRLLRIQKMGIDLTNSHARFALRLALQVRRLVGSVAH